MIGAAIFACGRSPAINLGYGQLWLIIEMTNHAETMIYSMQHRCFELIQFLMIFYSFGERVLIGGSCGYFIMFCIFSTLPPLIEMQSK